ncbi:Transmembrane amino acid transporter [Blattamonas nauphoetae]|uniref:Transmembrane amino acid transporter n=1 Tax=Blattamonas nauphoetae TaxID=2049346 RepID=A0ABQ9XEN0_9EUKA|nr:Transmembrane amino acid transporter [Blattamonas nauphoetae]
MIFPESNKADHLTRKKASWTKVLNSIIVLINSTLGDGVFGVPLAYAKGGMVGAFLIHLMVMIMSFISFYQLVYIADVVEEYSYGDLAAAILGTGGTILCLISEFVYCFGSLWSYVILLFNFAYSILVGFGIPETSFFVKSYFLMPVISFFLLQPLSWLPTISSMGFTSYVGIGCMLFVLSMVVFRFIKPYGEYPEKEPIQLFSWHFYMFQTFSTLCLALSYQPSIPITQGELKRGSVRHMWWILILTVVGVWVFYMMLGAFGYASFTGKFHDFEHSGNILSLYNEKDILATVARILAFVTVTLCFPANALPARTTTVHLLKLIGKGFRRRKIKKKHDIRLPLTDPTLTHTPNFSPESISLLTASPNSEDTLPNTAEYNTLTISEGLPGGASEHGRRALLRGFQTSYGDTLSDRGGLRERDTIGEDTIQSYDSVGSMLANVQSYGGLSEVPSTLNHKNGFKVPTVNAPPSRRLRRWKRKERREEKKQDLQSLFVSPDEETVKKEKKTKEEKTRKEKDDPAPPKEEGTPHRDSPAEPPAQQSEPAISQQQEQNQSSEQTTKQESTDGEEERQEAVQAEPAVVPAENWTVLGKDEKASAFAEMRRQAQEEEKARKADEDPDEREAAKEEEREESEEERDRRNLKKQDEVKMIRPQPKQAAAAFPDTPADLEMGVKKEYNFMQSSTGEIFNEDLPVEKCRICKSKGLRGVLLGSLLTLFACVLGLLMSKVNFVFDVIGSTAGVAVGFLIPGILFLRVLKNPRKYAKTPEHCYDRQTGEYDDDLATKGMTPRQERRYYKKLTPRPGVSCMCVVSWVNLIVASLMGLVSLAMAIIYDTSLRHLMPD